jgi:hypothetical protein
MKNEFIKYLTSLAIICNAELNEILIKLYIEHIENSIGFAQGIENIKKIIVERKAIDKFPSIRDIKDKSCALLEDKIIAIDVVNTLIRALRRHGSAWVYDLDYKEKFRKELGTLGVEVIKQLGGWLHFCDEAARSETTIFRAQIRELAEVVVKKHKAENIKSITNENEDTKIIEIITEVKE